jgi:hypothetical protein
MIMDDLIAIKTGNNQTVLVSSGLKAPLLWPKYRFKEQGIKI